MKILTCLEGTSIPFDCKFIFLILTISDTFTYMLCLQIGATTSGQLNPKPYIPVSASSYLPCHSRNLLLQANISPRLRYVLPKDGSVYVSRHFVGSTRRGEAWNTLKQSFDIDQDHAIAQVKSQFQLLKVAEDRRAGVCQLYLLCFPSMSYEYASAQTQLIFDAFLLCSIAGMF